MIIPFPDKAALQPVVGPVKLLIVRQASRPISHGMAIFAVNVRLIMLSLALAHLLKGLQPGVHRRIYVRDLRLKIPLVVDQAGGIHSPESLRLFFKVDAKGGFISQRPHNDRRMVAISCRHPDRPVHISRFPFRIVGDPVVNMGPLKSMALQIRLVDRVQAVLVAEIVDRLDGRIMGEADGVDIIPLHHQDILTQHLRIHGTAALRRIIVMVDAV